MGNQQSTASYGSTALNAQKFGLFGSSFAHPNQRRVAACETRADGTSLNEHLPSRRKSVKEAKEMEVRLDGEVVQLGAERYHLGKAPHGSDSLMDLKGEDSGTCHQPASELLKWGTDPKTANKVACFNRHYVTYWDQFNSKRQLTRKPSGMLAGASQFVVDSKRNLYGAAPMDTAGSEAVHSSSKAGMATGAFPRHYWDKSGPSGNSENLHAYSRETDFLSEVLNKQEIEQQQIEESMRKMNFRRTPSGNWQRFQEKVMGGDEAKIVLALDTHRPEDEHEFREMVFYDSASQKPLFVAPRGRTWKDFMLETKKQGKPIFKDEEVIQENVRILPDGAVVSVDGSHIGNFQYNKNLKGDRYHCNIHSIAGMGPAIGMKLSMGELSHRDEAVMKV